MASQSSNPINKYTKSQPEKAGQGCVWAVLAIAAIIALVVTGAIVVVIYIVLIFLCYTLYRAAVDQCKLFNDVRGTYTNFEELNNMLAEGTIDANFHASMEITGRITRFFDDDEGFFIQVQSYHSVNDMLLINPAHSRMIDSKHTILTVPRQYTFVNDTLTMEEKKKIAKCFPVGSHIYVVGDVHNTKHGWVLDRAAMWEQQRQELADLSDTKLYKSFDSIQIYNADREHIEKMYKLQKNVMLTLMWALILTSAFLLILVVLAII